MIYYSIFNNKIAPFEYFYNDEKIIYCNWITNKKTYQKNEYIQKKWDYLEHQLNAYFKGELIKFDINFQIENKSDFFNNVIKEMINIPYGKFSTYNDIAKKLGKPGGSRAVGQACRRNPIPVIIPCHRVTASDGIGGYSGKNFDSIELTIKKKLLSLEGVINYEEAKQLSLF